MHYKKYLSKQFLSASINCITVLSCVGCMDKSIRELVENKISQVELATACAVSQQAVSLWFKQNKIPPRRVPLVSKITGIRPEILNPEVFQ